MDKDFRTVGGSITLLRLLLLLSWIGVASSPTVSVQKDLFADMTPGEGIVTRIMPVIGPYSYYSISQDGTFPSLRELSWSLDAANVKNWFITS